MNHQYLYFCYPSKKQLSRNIVIMCKKVRLVNNLNEVPESPLKHYSILN